jgi:hypothetical protein
MQVIIGVCIVQMYTRHAPSPTLGRVLFLVNTIGFLLLQVCNYLSLNADNEGDSQWPGVNQN